MRLLGIDLRFDFVGEIREYTLAQQVHKAITGAKPKETRQQVAEDVMVRSPKRKLAVKWGSESFGVVLEEVTNIDDFTEVVMPLLDRINGVAPIDQLTGRMIITDWLLPTPSYDFAALEQKYRKTMMTPQSIQDGTFDSSVILDSKVKDWILHHQSGAMSVKQLLRDYLAFKPDNVPNVFLFLLTSIEETKVVQYSNEEMRNFLAKSFALCKSHSDAFERIWEGVL